MKVTVCQLSNDRRSLDREWPALADHCRSQGSDLVLLPEMPFTPWLASAQTADQSQWLSSVVEHDSWRKALLDLVPATVAGTEPIVDDGTNHNEAFVWSAVAGRRAVHRKYYLPNEAGFWEANWYEPGAKFSPGNFARHSPLAYRSDVKQHPTLPKHVPRASESARSPRLWDCGWAWCVSR